MFNIVALRPESSTRAVAHLWLEHRTPDPGRPVFDARCHQSPSEYTRSTCSLNQWVRSPVGLITSAGGLENSSLTFSLHAEIVEVEIEVVLPSVVPSGNFAEQNRTVTCMVIKVNDRSTPCHDEFRGPPSDCVRQIVPIVLNVKLNYYRAKLVLLYKRNNLLQVLAASTARFHQVQRYAATLCKFLIFGVFKSF
ncbi:hypothetical protein TNCV_1757151 [Trichonephila clavipes]|nr:hypothetical protein TNCV_1757151 [Trichonephila clavipes]